MSTYRNVSDQRVESIRALLEKQFAEPDISIKDISRSAGICEDHLRRLFKKQTHAPFRQYIRSLRMEEAKHLLLASDDEVKAIAITVGYRSHSHFTRDFRKHMGMSPQQFRQTCGAQPDTQGG
ncbi:MAG TPA: helix-turn-helix transcriptional regulator [Bryobacteraceae bacterium]